ncbi:hypothetical protein RRG08_063516 [Elysia crispata]|uniref:C-type lectin domain-containing protein n=1 Tax=Elysia crispata TaxID=231223 RepID=A0AAE1B4L0_9GAST|nr:hypothetical protein RRG08_063516 [Elysia crispata]
MNTQIMSRSLHFTEFTMTFLSLISPAIDLTVKQVAQLVQQNDTCTAEKYSFPCARNFTEESGIHKCLYFSKTKQYQQTAAQDCSRRHASLISVTSSAVEDAITNSSLFISDVWIGLSPSGTTWLWEANSEQMNYTNWRNQAPKTGDCVIKSKQDNYWRGASCVSEQHAYICEQPSLRTTPTDVFIETIRADGTAAQVKVGDALHIVCTVVGQVFAEFHFDMDQRHFEPREPLHFAPYISHNIHVKREPSIRECHRPPPAPTVSLRRVSVDR